MTRIFKVLDETAALVMDPRKAYMFRKGPDTGNGYDSRNFFGEEKHVSGDIEVSVTAWDRNEERTAHMVVAQSNSGGMILAKSLRGTGIYVVKYGWAPVGELDGPFDLAQWGFAFDAPHENNCALRMMLQQESVLEALLKGDWQRIVAGVNEINSKTDHKVLMTNYLKEVCQHLTMNRTPAP